MFIEYDMRIYLPFRLATKHMKDTKTRIYVQRVGKINLQKIFYSMLENNIARIYLQQFSLCIHVSLNNHIKI